MENVTATYDANELAWVTPILTLRRDVFLRITLREKGKVVIRQSDDKGNFPRVPIRRHKDTQSFEFRISVIPDTVQIQIFTSTEPKEIKYAYI